MPAKTKAKTTAKAYMLRTCAADGTSHGGFKWPASGPVTCPDWDPKPECGNGLHGLLWGAGNASYLSQSEDAIWQIVEIQEWVDIGGDKIKVPSGNVVYSGDMCGAMVGIATRWLAHLKETSAFDNEGDSSQLAASGDSSQLAASGDSSRLAASGDSSQLAASGDSSQLAASGDSSRLAASGYSSRLAASGDSSRLAASGYSSRLAASGDSSQLAASGDSSQLAASGYSSRLAASGDSSQLAASGDSSIAMCAGPGSSAAAGPNGTIALSWWDQAAKRYRVIVGYVGEDGIEPNTYYCVQNGKLVATGATINPTPKEK